ncbi:hypothetical protein O3689_11730 [Prevotella nigrescens]|uniref:hypothetical protein n=1 Tax=Prevotella nigrescens TaxID=28133 RepID=UPI00352CE45C
MKWGVSAIFALIEACRTRICQERQNLRKHSILRTQGRQQSRKHFSQTQPLRKRLSVSTLQQQLYGIAKQWVLCGKSGSFTLQNSRFCNAEAQMLVFNKTFLTKSERFYVETAPTSQGRNLLRSSIQ